MRPLLCLLLCGLAVTAARAATWSPFIGVSGLGGVLGSSYHVTDYAYRGRHVWRGYPAYGAQVTVGLRAGRFDTFLAYRDGRAQSIGPEDVVIDVEQTPYLTEYALRTESRDQWIDRRLWLGGHWYLAAAGQRVRPLVGLALAFGRPVRKHVECYESWNSDTEQIRVFERTQTATSRYPRVLSGGELAFGFAVGIVPRLEVQLLSSVAVAWARFYQTGQSEGVFENHLLLSPAAQLGARYTFSSLHFGK